MRSEKLHGQKTGLKPRAWGYYIFLKNYLENSEFRSRDPVINCKIKHQRFITIVWDFVILCYGYNNIEFLGGLPVLTFPSILHYLFSKLVFDTLCTLQLGIEFVDLAEYTLSCRYFAELEGIGHRFLYYWYQCAEFNFGITAPWSIIR